MSIKEAIIQLQAYKGPLELTLHTGADEALLQAAEEACNIKLPDDFKDFYRFCDGFETDEDIFNMIPLTEIIENQMRTSREPLYIAEYMIYSDMWLLEINPDNCNDYKIIINAEGHKLVLTNSLAEFIHRFLQGGVFEPGGLNEWQNEVAIQPVYSTYLKTAEDLLTVFYYGLIYGVISREEIITWADSLIMRENEPENFFIELSLSHDNKELISLLHSVHGPQSYTAARALLGFLYHRLANNFISTDKVITVLDSYKSWNLLTRNETIQIYGFTDLIWMDELNNNDDQLKEDLLSFLINYENFEIANYKLWFAFSTRILYQNNKDENESSPKRPIERYNYEIKPWVIYITYSLAILAVIVLATNYTANENKVPLSKFRSDAYQLSSLYITFFIIYHIRQSGKWLVKKAATKLKKWVNWQ